MALNLSDATTGSSAFVGGISIDNLSWWFWVKAGIGFTLGGGFVTVVSVLVYVRFLLPIYLRWMLGGLI